MSYVSNNIEIIKTEVGQFMIEQRNVGFADNDGRWIVDQFPELYWSSIGVLHRRRPGVSLGIFDDRESALAAIERAEVQPIKDEPVRSMGRVSC